ncbi:MAG: acetylglutamate kinase [Patescibacteria group bacterium]|nr:acetylglutamate kinase [Patescibacteria group bacterium]
MLIIKIGGGKEINLEYIAEDLKKFSNEKIIIVLGANYYRNELAKKLNIEIKIIESESGYKSVYTHQDVIDLMLMTYAGLQAKKLSALLIKNGIKSISLCGIDGKLILAKRKKNLTARIENKVKLITDNYTGKIEKINKKLIDYFLGENYVVILTPPAISEEGEILNIDNDQVIYHLTQIYQPENIIFLIEAQGILYNKNITESLIPTLKLSELEDLIKESEDYGFQKKLLNIKKISELKRSKIIIADGRYQNPISKALNNIGTTIIYE